MENTNNVSSFKRFFSYLIPYKWYFIIAIIFGMIKFLLPVYVAWMFGKIISTLTDDNILIEQKYDSIILLISIGIGLSIITPVFVYFRTILSNTATQKVINDLRVDLFAHVQGLSHSFFDYHLAGSITSRIINDVSLTQVFLKQVIVQSWMHIGVVIVILSYFFTVNWRLAIFSLLLIPIQIIVMKFVGHKIKKVSIDLQEDMAQLSGLTMESISNISIVRVPSSPST
ncbi:MAG: hypothetical protein COA79_15995 [Planctomycetota bacterium]|nr:MAG: hypothetical protein COA79_15995 [Planctomycetota bacterium]